MQRLNHEVALLKMRTEQWRIHLRSVPASSPEGLKVRSLLAAMKKCSDASHVAPLRAAAGRRCNSGRIS
jgi:hypothetical protein